MNKATLTLALAALTVASASAGDIFVKEFPPQLPPQLTPKTTKQHRAPLNQEKKRGDKVFGYTMVDNTRLFSSYVNYYSNEYFLDYVGPGITQQEEDHMRSLYVLRAGAYNPDDGFYYAYKCKYYTIGITQAYKFVKVNPTTGEWSEIMDLNDDYKNTYLYELAYNAYSSEMFALTQNNDGTLTTRICKLDIPGGSKDMTDFINLGDYYLCGAFDYDGYFYGVRWVLDTENNNMLIGSALDKFDKNFKRIDTKELLVDGKPFLSYYQHGMDVDYTTGDLVWAATDAEGNQVMVRINPETAATKRMGNHGVGFQETMCGLYVPYTVAEDREAPAIVNDLEFAIDKNGANKVTISWTNPKTLWNRQPMTNLQNVKVYRDDPNSEPLTTIDAAGKEGKYLSYTDTEATQGVHKYYVMAFNEAGRGVETCIEAYVGHDKPGAVNNLEAVATADGLGVKLTWKAPTVGDSEGWFDKTITYNIKRLPDNKQVASGVSALEYTDANIEEAQFYSYEITPVNEQGAGTPATSNGVLAGASIKIPFTSTFGNQAEADRFTSFGPVGDYPMFTYESPSIYTDPMVPAMRFNYSTGDNNAVLVSPKLNVKKGQKYRVDWKFVLHRYGYAVEDAYHSFRILGGTEPKYESMKDNVLWEDAEFLTVKSKETHTVTTYFTAPVDGDYCIGFQVLSKGDADQKPGIDMLKFAIDYAPANDLEATKLQAPAIVSNTFDNVYNVTVYNNGDNDQSDFEVQVGLDRSNGEFVPISAAKSLSTLKSHEYAVVRVVGHAEGHNGEQELRARVILKNDENDNNNFTDYVPVTITETDAYAYCAIDRDTENYKTWLPFGTAADAQSGSQTIYTRKDLELQPDQEIEISGVAYEYMSDDNVKDLTGHIWLGTTDQENYGADKAPIMEGMQQMVAARKLEFAETKDRTIYPIPFDEGKSFKLPAKKNLVVTFGAENKSVNYNFALKFFVYNDDITVSDGENHSLWWNNVFDPNQTQGQYTETVLPNLYLIIKQPKTDPYNPNEDPNSIETIGISKGMSVKVVAGEAILNGVETLALYDLSGAMIMNLNVNGAKAVKLPVEKGVYILRVANASEVKTVKIAL